MSNENNGYVRKAPVSAKSGKTIPVRVAVPANKTGRRIEYVTYHGGRYREGRKNVGDPLSVAFYDLLNRITESPPF